LRAAAGVAGVVLVGGCGNKEAAPPPPPGAPPAPAVPTGVMAVQNPDGTFRVPNGASVKAGEGLVFNTPPNNAPGIIFKDASGKLSAISGSCTHAGGPIKWNPKNPKQPFHCPYHNSVFDVSGKPVSGPAKRPLTPYPVKVDGKDAIVTVKA
jgi:Rieske Fe-S protein